MAQPALALGKLSKSRRGAPSFTSATIITALFVLVLLPSSALGAVLDCTNTFNECEEITDVTSYTDSTSSTVHRVKCYKPTYCNTMSCPLYVWVDGTSQNAIEPVDEYFLGEMVDRGFVSCVALYDDAATGYTGGCDSFRTKAQDIFDPNRGDLSLTGQICGVHADCNMGIATITFGG